MGGAVERVDKCGMYARFPHVCLGCLHQIEQVDQCAAGNFDHMFHDDEYGTLNSGKQCRCHSGRGFRVADWEGAKRTS